MILFKWITIFAAVNVCMCQNIDPGYMQMLFRAFNALGSGGQQGPSGDAIMSIVGSYLQNNQDTIIGYLTDTLKTALEEGTINSTSAVCRNHTEMFIDALVSRENWALRMIDAFGKPVPGLMEYRLNWLGNYDECIGTMATVYVDPVAKVGVDHPYTGKYCTMSIPFGEPTLIGITPALTIGLCLPETCTATDGAAIVNKVVESLPLNMTLQKAGMTCQEKSLEFTDKALVVTIVGAVFAGIILLATAYDVIIQHVLSQSKSSSYQQGCQLKAVNGVDNAGFTNIDTKEALANEEKVMQNGKASNGLVALDVNTTEVVTKTYKPGIPGKLLLSFSIYTNAPKILSTSQPKGTLTCVNGIRFLSMSYVILGHTLTFGIQTIGNISTFIPTMYKRFTFQVILNGTFSVDSFFVLSGLLVSYLSLREMKKRGGAKQINWFMYYFHRYWRLTPPYMLVLMLYVPTLKYWASGPMWVQTGIEVDECRTTWWKSILYLNNVWDAEKQCMGWGWYLANDMQFYVICPIMLIPLFYSPVAGGVVCLVLLVATFVASGLVSSHNHFAANILFQPMDGADVTEIYSKPWTRIGPYIVGVFTGYILYKTDCKVKMSKLLNAAGWTIATAIAMSALYGLYTPDGSPPDLSNSVSSLYNALARTAWGVSVAWVIFACATGYGGPVNGLLSWPGTIPLSRLTYCAYLVHPLVMYYYFMSRHALAFWDDVHIIFLFLALMCLSYGAAFVVSLAFESPMMGLERVLLGRRKNS